MSGETADGMASQTFSQSAMREQTKCKASLVLMINIHTKELQNTVMGFPVGYQCFHNNNSNPLNQS